MVIWSKFLRPVGGSDGGPSAMAAFWRLFRELQLRHRMPLSRVEGRPPYLTTDRGRLQRAADLPHRERQVRRHRARWPERGARNPYPWTDGRRKLVGSCLYR